MRVVWTPTAREGAREVELYIYEHFSARALMQFIAKTESTLKEIEAFPQSGAPYKRDDELNVTYRTKVINRRSILLYHIEDDIIIDDFWSVKMNK